MNIAIFKKLETLLEEGNMCWSAIVKANREANEMIYAVEKRIENEKKTDEARISFLENQITGTGKSATVQRVAGMELEELKAKEYKITTKERAAVQEVIDVGKAALSDTKKIRIEEALKEATLEIKAVRDERIGSMHKDPELAQKWLTGLEEKLSRL
jgi:hypothetical protein